MSDTPRTDAQADRYGPAVMMSNIVTADFARQLERELAEARKDALRYRWLRVRNEINEVDPPGPFAINDDTDGLPDFPTGAELDAAIDAAMNNR